MNLKEHHRIVAEATRGISSEHLYDIHERLLRDRGLGGDILDFAAGKAFLTQRLAHSGRFTSVTAVDLLPKPSDLDPVIHWVNADLEDPLSLPAESFDVIVCCEAISCFENPRALGREWFRLLRPGGTLLLSTPNSLSLRTLLSLFVQGHFVEFGPRSYPYQKTALVPLDIERIYTEAGFDKPEIAFSNVGGIPKMPSRTWQSVFGRLLKGRWFSDHVFAIGKKPMRAK
jgi:2-polyprenyl-3-methyl-5-hydroxy-6-metoxy-1,4-benzoquinol methylase